ncbi:BTAD domain-containing putative transcriptional regulator [Streptomyces sp. NPDC060184]|uniref:BTAD domain-containing putative transcriptional regulator n=1 Tax=Streptomyces sp. NPDC060184 TaxID=3347064 RepID=UPI00365B7C98
MLGPLEVGRGAENLDAGPPTRRVLLLRLLLENGRAVSVERLCDDLWEGRPPASAVSSVQAHISRLRAVLEPERAPQDRGRVLRRVPTGYALRIPPESRDTVLFERALRRAHGLAAGSGSGRGEALREIEGALRMWRGTPFADAAHKPFAAGEVTRLEELGAGAEEFRTTLLFEEGRTAQAIIGAESLVERHPLRETSWVLLMRALYAAGRHAEALQRYETVRALLARELGLDPGPALRATQVAVLRHDTESLCPSARPLDRPAPASVPARALASVPAPEPAPVPDSPPASVPASLPAGVPSSVAPPPPRDPVRPLRGREEEMARLSVLLGEAAGGRTGWAVVSGGPGVGRTRLAEEVARQAAASGFRVVWARCAGSPGAPWETRDGPVDRLAFDLRDRAAAPSAGPDADVPVLYVVDDLQRADAGLSGLLTGCARGVRGAAFAVLCTVSDDPGRETDRLLADLASCGADLMHLAPLSRAAVRLIARDSGTKCPGSTSTLHGLSGGNPFLLTELLKLPPHLRTGVCARTPPAVRSVTRVGLAGLTPAARRIVDVVAVLGDRPDMALVARLAALPSREVRALADEGVAAGLLAWSEAPDSRRPGGGYVFPAGLLRRAVLAEMAPSRREFLYAEAARSHAPQPGPEAPDAVRHTVNGRATATRKSPRPGRHPCPGGTRPDTTRARHPPGGPEG